jgi:nicotinamidase-related amidase
MKGLFHMDKLPKNAVLLLIDVQKGFDEPAWGQRNNPNAEENMARLLSAWRKGARPVFHVQHLSIMPNSPLRPENPGSAIKDAVKPLPGEPLFKKHVNSAFIGTDLEAQLRQNGYDTLVIVGLTTQHCVSTTARMAGNLGFKTYVVSDATAAFSVTGPDGIDYSAEQVHALSLATIHNEFAQVVDTETVLNAL